MREQKRGLKIATTPEEVDALLREERMCRLGRGDADGNHEPKVRLDHPVGRVLPR